jgi:hypothetical protein
MRMCEVRPFVVAAAVVTVASNIVVTQSDSPYRVLTNRGGIQKALDGLAASGERVLIADAGIGLVIAQKGEPRTYLYVEDLERFITNKKVPAGFVFMPETFGSNGEGRLRALMEKVEGDEKVRDYRFLKSRNSSALSKQIEPAFADGYGLVGVVAGGGDAAVVVERTSIPPRRWMVIGAAQSGTMEKELTATNGFRIASGAGDGEAVYGLVEEPGATDYLLLSTTKSETLEKELNAAAEKGYRVVPGSLLGMQKRLFGKPVADGETFVVMARRPDDRPVLHRVLGILRGSTLQRELTEATAQGFTPTGMSVGFKETVVLLEKPR